MAKSKSRVQKLFEEHPIETKINLIVAGLNNGLHIEGGNLNSRELLVLVKRFQKLETVIRDTGRKLTMKGKDGKRDADPYVWSLFVAINRSLKRHAAIPHILPYFMLRDPFPTAPVRGWEQIWIPTTGKREQHFDQLFLVLTIVEIARAGRIVSLKQCENCHKWLFARFPHQRFCSETCKDHYHRSNEADKKRRRDWARENYRTRKVLETGNKNIK